MDAGACFKDDAFKAASADNTTGLTATPVAPFGKAETGWAIYAPLVGREIATACGPGTPAFAAALGRWQAAHALSADGRMSAATLSAMSMAWLLRRPFVRAMKNGCPASPNEQTLARAAPDEAWGSKSILLRPATLDAYRRMVAAARAETGVKPPALTLASGYRGPSEEAARCADGSCGNPAKARCSAHRTGLAFDLYLDDKPGPAAFSTRRRRPAASQQDPGVSMAGEERRPFRLRPLSVRALALGVDGRKRLTASVEALVHHSELAGVEQLQHLFPVRGHAAGSRPPWAITDHAPWRLASAGRFSIR